MISLHTPNPWPDYALIDSGNFRKLERFGKWILERPEPQAIWSPSLSETDWQRQVAARFSRSKSNPESGIWEKINPQMPDRWFCHFKRPGLEISYKLSLSSFKHVGLFPEQAWNWDFSYAWIQSFLRDHKQAPKVLNLFAYTGIASVVARKAGAEVTHLDSIKQVVTWARENMEASGLDGIRWMVDDALKFVKREERRQSHYQMIILDPPAYGRGPDGEKWMLEENLPDILSACKNLLDPDLPSCIILNLYSLGWSGLMALNLMNQVFQNGENRVSEIYLEDDFGKKLPLGLTGRFLSE
jgi:23S rRNA (cytosine1962-C5)-methyltransferase